MGGRHRTRGCWKGMENIILIKFEVKKYSHIEPESLLQEFLTNSVAIRYLLTDFSALSFNVNIVVKIST